MDLVSQREAAHRGVMVRGPGRSPAGAGGGLAQLVARRARARAIRDRDPPAGGDPRLLSAGGAHDGLRQPGEQPAPREREVLLSVREVVVARVADAIAVLGERFADVGDRVGLAVDRQ